MARDRQRSKQRQAERRAARLAERQTGDPRVRDSAPDGDGVEPGPTTEAELAATAPQETTGRSDTVLDPLPPTPADESELAEETELADDEDFTEDDERELVDAGAGPVGRRGDESEHRERGKVLGFLAASWAELQRVQWPDRKAVTTLTGVVLGFVLIAGGYLGLLDAIFSRIIDQIL